MSQRFVIQDNYLFKGLLSLCLLALCATVASAKPCERVLSMGWEPYEPYQYLENGKMKGLEIEIIQSVMEKIKCTIRYEQLPWKRVLSEIEAGKIDFTAGASKLPEREIFAFYSSTYRHEAFTLFVRSDKIKQHNFTSLTALGKTDFRLGIAQDYYYGEELAQLQTEKKIITESVWTDKVNFQKLLNNRIDGFLIDPVVGKMIIQNDRNYSQIVNYPLDVITGDVYFIFSRSSITQEWMKEFDDNLKLLIQDGTLKKIIDSYIH